jgi:hypothetical protein
MYLSNTEHEAFVRGQTAGLIPTDFLLPKNDQEINELIYHVGILVSARIGHRDASDKLRVMELTAFTSEHLDKLTANALFRQTSYPNWLQGLYNYFSYGPRIVTAEDLAGRLALHNTKLSVTQIMKGFELEYIPKSTTPRQWPVQVSDSVDRLLTAFEKLNHEEKTILSNIITQKAG